MATITAGTATTDRNTKVLFRIDQGASFPYALYEPVRQTGEGQFVEFEYFRFPEPQQNVELIEGDSILILDNKDISSPPDFNLSTDNSGALPVDTLTLLNDATLTSDPIYGDFPQAYFISYNYDLNYTWQDNYHYSFNINASSEWVGIGAIVRLRLIFVDPDNTGDRSYGYRSIFGSLDTSGDVEVFGTFSIPDQVHTHLASCQIVITTVSVPGVIVSSGATIDIEYNSPIPYITDPDGFVGVLPRVDIWDIDSVTHVVATGSATATINASKTKVGDISTTIQYSLNGVDYQNSNVFTELDNGSYTAYILDTYGLVEELAFEIGDVIPPEEERPDSFLDISPVNSIQFSDEANQSTFFSRYDKQKFTNIEFKSFYQLFTQNDAIPTQIRTNYETIIVDVINCVTGEIVQNPIAQLKIKNQNLKDKRDCVLGASVEAGFTNIYFQGGNVYDPDTDVVLGKNTLNGDLENWMKEGVKVTISDQSPGSTLNGSYDIVDRLYNSNIPAEVMVISATFAELEAYQVAILESEYDDEIWDVYEFTTDFSQLPKGYYYIRVSVTDTNSQYEDMSFISEPILVGDNSKALQIDYKSDSRVIYDLYSSTGISHRLRIPSQLYEYAPIQEIDSFNDDFNNEIIKKRTTKASLTLKTGFIPPYLARKLNLAFLHSLQGDTFTIDNVQYTPLGESEVEAKSSERNPFVTLVQQMQATEGAVSVDSSGVISGDSANVLGAGTNKVIGV